MDPRAATRGLSGEEGFTSLQFVLAAGLAMFMVVGLVQLVTYQYARGAVMAALERGVRTASVATAGAAECEAVVADSLDSVLGGEVGQTLAFGCEADVLMMRAWATGSVPSWIAGVPAMPFSLEAHARREVEG